MSAPWQLQFWGVYWVILLILVPMCIGNNSAQGAVPADGTNGDVAGEKLPKTAEARTPLQMYQRLFKHKRATHIEAVNTILNLGDYQKQHKMITLVLDKLFKVLTDSQVNLMAMGFSPGDPFPANETVRDAFSNVVENTAFFGDLVLRLPDIVHDVMKRKKDWSLLIQWGVGFCDMAQILEETDARLLHLMSQELGITEKDPNYINPYKAENIKAGLKPKDDLEEYTKQVIKKQQKKKQKEKRKGPRLSGGHREL